MNQDNRLRRTSSLLASVDVVGHTVISSYQPVFFKRLMDESGQTAHHSVIAATTKACDLSSFLRLPPVVWWSDSDFLGS